MAANAAKALERLGSAAIILGAVGSAVQYSMYDGMLIDCIQIYNNYCHSQLCDDSSRWSSCRDFRSIRRC